jgi:hypothetical protein
VQQGVWPGKVQKAQSYVPTSGGVQTLVAQPKLVLSDLHCGLAAEEKVGEAKLSKKMEPKKSGPDDLRVRMDFLSH